MAQPFHINTPLLESVSMSKLVGTPVYLKMENSQPSGSFKIRGIGHLCQQLARFSRGIVCASGGNAGMAAAYSARKMGLTATIIVPSSTPQLIVLRLQQLGANVKIVGKAWDDANTEALRVAESDGLVLIPPFDHPLLWEGHATIMAEIADSLGPNVKPGAVVLSVGGGGLLCGVIQGLKNVGWSDVPVIAMETIGANCFNAAIKAGKVVTLNEITSEAKCLGAKTVCNQAFEYSQCKDLRIISEVVPDRQALRAIQTFLDDERALVEMACGAALAVVYNKMIQKFQRAGYLPTPLGPLVVIVCGGSSINTDYLASLKKKIL